MLSDGTTINAGQVRDSSAASQTLPDQTNSSPEPLTVAAYSVAGISLLGAVTWLIILLIKKRKHSVLS